MTRDEILASYASGNRVFSGAYLRDAYLRDADLSGADLRDADLRGANLSGANLGDADLHGADLRDADLRDADLQGAYLGGQWIVQGPTRSDGYQFILTNFKDEGVRLKAGCRNFTITEAVKHWKATRGGTPLGEETYVIINQLVELAWVRGLIDDKMESTTGE